MNRFAKVLMTVALGATASAAVPAGWNITGNGPQFYDFAVDSAATDGRRSAVIAAKSEPPAGQFGSYVQNIAADDYRGSRLRLSAKLRTQDANRAQMWMRVDGKDGPIAFDNMDARPVTGNTDWKQYDIVLDVSADAAAIFYGFFLSGKGKVWADSFRLEKVGNDVPTTGTPRRARAPVNLGFEE